MKDKPTHSSTKSSTKSLVEVNSPPTQKESIVESVVDVANKVYVFTDDGIRDFPDKFSSARGNGLSKRSVCRETIC